MGSRLSINLGLGLGLVVALLFGVLRIQSLIHNYGSDQWNAGYKQAVSEIKIKQQAVDNGQLQSNLVIARQQAADNAKGVETYEAGIDSLHATVDRLRASKGWSSAGPSCAGILPSTAAAAASVHAGTALADDGLAGVPRDELIQHSEWCDQDRESLIGLQGYVRTLPLNKSVSQPTVGNDVVATPR